MVEVQRQAQAKLEPNTTCWPGCQRTQPKKPWKPSEAVRNFTLLFSPGATLGCAWAWNAEILNYLPPGPLCLLVASSFDKLDAKISFFFLSLGCNFPNDNHFILKHPTMPETKDSESVRTSIPFLYAEFSNSGQHSLLILIDIILWSLHHVFSRYSLQNSNLPLTRNDS